MHCRTFLAFFYAALFLGMGLFAYPVEVDIIRKNIHPSQVYFVTIALGVVGSVLSMPFAIICGFLSQPERLGRKIIVLLLTMVTSAAIGMPVLWPDQIWCVLALRVWKLINQVVMIQMIQAWVTDFCPASQKAAYFVILSASCSGGSAVSATVSGVLKRREGWSDREMLLLSFYVSIGCCLWCALLFPRGAATGHRRAPSLFQGGEARRAACKALKYLIRDRPSVLFVSCILQFTAMGTTDSLALFLEKARGFLPEDVSAEMAVVCWAGLAIQAGIVPLAELMGMRVSSEVLLVVASICACAHIATMGLLESKVWIIALSPIGTLGYIGSAACAAMISGEEYPPEDQGTLLGVFSAFASAAGAVGPLAVAPLLTATRGWPPAIVGLPYVVLAVLVLPAVAVSVRLCCRRQTPSLLDSAGCQPAREGLTDVLGEEPIKCRQEEHVSTA